MSKPLGTWPRQEQINSGWRLEALSVIAWAAGITEHISAYDQQADERRLIRAIGLLHPTSRFISKARMRPAALVGRARDTAEFWLWRARTYQIQKDPQKYPPPPGYTYEKIISMSADQGEKEGLFRAINHDFPAFGKPSAGLTESEWSTMQSIAAERLYGLNWLCGYATDWDHVPTDT